MKRYLIKNTLTLSLLAVCSFALLGQIPKINGLTGVKVEMVPEGYAKRFVASGCPVDSFYVWEYRNLTRGGDFRITWSNSSFNLGSGQIADENRVVVETVELGNDGLYVPSSMQYRVSCSSRRDTLQPNNPKAVIELRVVKKDFSPTLAIAEIKCGTIGTNAGGSISLNAGGGGECVEGYDWIGQNNQPINEDADLRFSGNYANGIVSVACVFTNVKDSDGAQGGLTSFHRYVGGRRSIEVKKYYAPPTPSLTNLLLLFKNPEYQAKVVNGNSKVEICKEDELFVTALNIAQNRSSYAGIYDFNFSYRTPETQGAFITLPDGTGTNQVKASVSGIYGLRIEDRQLLNGRPVCLARPIFVDNATLNNTPGLEVKIHNLAVPSISSVTNFKVCPDGSTALVAIGATNANSYIWSIDDVVSSSNTSELSINTPGKINVSYLSNLSNSLGTRCPSPVSENVTVTSFLRPDVPTISSSGKTSYCEYLSVSDRLTAVSNQAVSWLWNNGGSTREISVNDYGTYSVKITDANGCTANSTTFIISKITRPSAPTVALASGSSSLNCIIGSNGNPTTVNLLINAADDNRFSYQWFSATGDVAVGSGSSLNGITGSATGSTSFYAIRTDKTTNCFSEKESSKAGGLRLTFQANPVDNAAKITKEAYTLKAGFADVLAGATGKEFDWKYGNTALPETGKQANAFNANGGNGDYTVRRKYGFTIEGRPLDCWSNLVKYTYVADPDFSGVIVYPNPTTSDVKVSVLDQATWSNANVLIYDMAGRLIYNGVLTGTAIPTNNLGNGVYVLNIRSNNGEKTFQTKLVVNK